MDGGPPSSRPPSAFFCPPHSAWQLIAHSYALLDSQMANTRIERSKAKQRLEGRAIALAFRRPTAERLSGRRADCCGEFGSLSLKGGGQEGVSAASSHTGPDAADRSTMLGEAAPTPSCPPPLRERDPTSSSRSTGNGDLLGGVLIAERLGRRRTFRARRRVVTRRLASRPTRRACRGRACR